MQRKHLVLLIERKHYVGPDSFTYTWTDGLTAGNATTVLIDIYSSAPYAYDASFSVLHDRELVGQLYGYDPDGDTITAQLISDPSNGTLTFHPDGTFTYTPNTHYVGPDSFTYTWSDGMGSSDVGTISIDVGTYAEDELCALMIETDGETRVPYCNADDEVVHWTRHDMLHI